MLPARRAAVLLVALLALFAVPATALAADPVTVSGDGRARRRARHRRPGRRVGHGERPGRLDDDRRAGRVRGPGGGRRRRPGADRRHGPDLALGARRSELRAAWRRRPASLDVHDRGAAAARRGGRDGRRPDRDGLRPTASPRITPPSTDATAGRRRIAVRRGPAARAGRRMSPGRGAASLALSRAAAGADPGRPLDLDPAPAAGHPPDPRGRRPAPRGGRAAPARWRHGRPRPRSAAGFVDAARTAADEPDPARDHVAHRACRARSPTRRASRFRRWSPVRRARRTSRVPSRVAPSPVPAIGRASETRSSRSPGFARATIGHRASWTWLPSAISSTDDRVVLERGDREPRGAVVDAAHRVEQVGRRPGPGAVAGPRLLERRGRVPERHHHVGAASRAISSRAPGQLRRDRDHAQAVEDRLDRLGRQLRGRAQERRVVGAATLRGEARALEVEPQRLGAVVGGRPGSTRGPARRTRGSSSAGRVGRGGQEARHAAPEERPRHPVERRRVAGRREPAPAVDVEVDEPGGVDRALDGALLQRVGLDVDDPAVLDRDPARDDAVRQHQPAFAGPRARRSRLALLDLEPHVERVPVPRVARLGRLDGTPLHVRDHAPLDEQRRPGRDAEQAHVLGAGGRRGDRRVAAPEVDRRPRPARRGATPAPGRR